MKNVINSFAKVFTLTLAVIVLFAAFSIQANAATKVSAGSGNWNTAGTWSPSGVPVAGDAVVITGGYTVTVDVANAVCTTVQLGLTGYTGSGTLAFNSGSQLTVSSTVTIGQSGSSSRFGVVNMTSGGTLICASIGAYSNGTDQFIPGTGTLQLTGTANFPASTSAAAMNSFNNLIISAGTSTLNVTPLTVGGNLTVNGGTFIISNSFTTRTVTVTGDVTVGSGTLTMSSGSSIGTLNVAGDFTSSGGTITETSTGSGAIVFNGGTTQTYTSGATISNTINFTVNSGTTLQMASATTVVSGGGTFTLSSGATLGVTSTAGITTTGTASGNIQTTTGRTYTAGANYIYNGSANQAVGTGLTANTPANVTIANTGSSGSNTVTLGATTTISGALTMTSGILDLAAHPMTVGDLTGSANITSGTAGAVLLTTGSDGTSTTYSGSLQNGSGTVSLTKTGSGTLTLSGASTYSGTTTISAGVIKIGAAGDGTNSPLGVVGGITSVTSGAALDLNGITLSTAEPLTLNGTGVSSGGALTNSSSTAANYSGLITLGSTGVSIVASSGDINLTNTGTITGSGYALTLSGTSTGSSIASIIGTGAGTLTKSGTGTWTLSGNSSFTGTTTISAGTIKLGAAGDGTNSPLGVTGGITSVTSGAALDLNGFTLSTAEPLTLNGTGVSSGGALTNSSATAASYSGLITLGSTGVSIITNSGDINITNAGTITGATFGLTIGGTGNGSIASIIGTTSGTVTKSGNGTWTLSGASTYTGLTTISAGTIKLGAAGGATNTPLGTTGAGTTVSSGGTLDLNGFTLGTTEALSLAGTGASSNGALTNSSATAASYSGLITLAATASILTNSGDINITNAGTIAGATFGLTIGGSGNGSIASIIGTTSGTVTKSGTGTWTLSGASTYTGLTTISAGTLKLGAAGGGTNTPLGTTGAGTTVSSGGTLDLNEFTLATAEALTLNGTGASSGGALTNSSATAVTYSGLIALGSAATINAPSGTIGITNAGTITGSGYGLTLDGAGGGSIASIIGTVAGTVTKTGTGTWTLSGASTYTGSTLISQGTLKLGAAGGATNTPLGTIGTGTTVSSGGTLDLNGFTLGTAEALSLNGTGSSSAGALTNSSSTAVTYSGLLTLGGSATINAPSGTIGITNVGTITGSGNGLTLDGAGGGSIASIIGTGAGTLTKNGSGTWTLTGTNTFTGGATLNLGKLNINNTQALGTSAGTFTINAGTIDNTNGGLTTVSYPIALNGDFTFTGTNALNFGTGTVTLGGSSQVTVTASTLTFGGTVSGGGYDVTKLGSGTLSFGANTVTLKNLTISAGTLGSTSGTLNLTGNFVNNGTAFTANGGLVQFNGSAGQAINGSTATTFNSITDANTSAALSVNVNPTVNGTLTINSNAVLTPAAAVIIGGGGTLTGNGTAQVTRTAATADLSSQYTITTKTLTNLTVAYVGGAAQVISALTYGNLSVDNPSGVTFGGSVVVGGTLTLSNGTFAVGANTLSLNGPAIAGTPSNLSTTSSSNLSFGGSSSGITIPSSVTALNDLTVNNASGISQGGSLTLNGTLTLTAGSYTVGANTLTLDGPAIAGTATNLVTSSSSSLSFGGSSSSVAIPSTVTALNNLAIGNSAGVALNSNLVVSGTYTPTSGALTVGAHTLTLNGSVPTGSGTLSTTSSSNLSIGGSATGIEIPGGFTALNNFTLNNTNGATLNSSPTISGTMTLTSGNLITGSNTVTIASLTGLLSEATGAEVVGNVALSAKSVGSTGTETFNGLGASIILNGTSPGSTTVSRATGSASTGKSTTSIWRTFDIVPTTNSGLNATLVYHYADNDLHGQNESTLLMYKSTDGGTNWIKVGGVVNTTLNTDTVYGVNSFSKWTAADAAHVIGDTPIPTITNITPDTKVAGQAGFTITVDGTNFANGVSTVQFNGNDRVTTYVSATQITAQILASDLASSGIFDVTVFNSGGGGVSNAWGFSVDQAHTTTTVTSSVNPSVSGESVTFKAKVTPATSGIPTGDITFTVDGVAQTPVTMVGDSAEISKSFLATGTPHTVVADYPGDPNYYASTSSTFNQNVNKAATTTSLTASLASSTYGQSVTFKAVVATTAPGTGTPAGNVTFTIDGVAQSPVALVGDSAIFTKSDLPVLGSPHSISAKYDGSADYDSSVSSGITHSVSKASATVVLSNLVHTYDGTAKSAGATTTPTGLTVDFTYNGSSTAPTNVGHYYVVGTINDNNYQGSANDTLIINKATATVVLSNLTHVYNGSPYSPTVATTPTGLTVDLTYNGSPTAPTNVGSYYVVATINEGNYSGSSSDTLHITKATAAVVLSNLAHTYDGTGKAATAATTPTGLTVDLTYNGSPALPINAGKYYVVGTINDPNYQGSANDTLAIGKASATVVLSSLIHTYDGTGKAAIATPTPTGLTVDLTYDGSATLPINAGKYYVVGTVNDLNYQGSANDTLLINKAAATVVLSNLNHVYNGSPYSPTVTTTPTGLTVDLTYNGSPTAPTNVGNYYVVATINEGNYSGSSSDTLHITKATATVVLSGLTHTYDGTGKAAIGTPTPTGLTVDLTYDGSATLPINAGKYYVVGTINDPNYQGSANDTLVISKAAAPVVLSNLSHVYNGSPYSPTVTTTPAGLTVDVTYNGSPTVPTNVGSYYVVATVNEANYSGSTSDTLHITKAAATVALTNLSHVYNGSPYSPTVTTTPTGLTVDLTYNGSPTAPTVVGNYEVVATINEANYSGSTSDTLHITKATATVVLSSLTHTYDGTGKAAIATPTPTGLTVDLTYNGSATLPINAGKYYVVGTVNDPNYQGSSSDTLTIGKANASVVLSNLIHTYDGAAKTANATTTPTGLTVDLTYDGSATAPMNTGHYVVVGTIVDANYVGSATDTLKINKATATVVLASLIHTYDGTQKTATATTTPLGLTVDLTYNGSATAPTNAGEYVVVGTVVDANYQGSATDTLKIGKAVPTVSLLSSKNPSAYEDTVTFTAHVVNGSNIPTGSVAFYDGSTLIGSGSLDGSGNAEVSTHTLIAGSHAVKVVYDGDANFKADSTTITQNVDKRQAHAQITSNLNPSLFEQHVTFTLHVTNGTNVPTGNVVFYDGASLLGTIALDGSGNAAYSDSTLAVGSHDIKGIYGGDGNFLADSSTVTQVVNHASPTMAMLSSLNPSVYEDTVTFSVTVHNGSHTPGGTITFYDGTTELGSTPLVSGAASLTTAALTAGSHVIKAVYSGDGSFTADSTQLTQTVNMHQGHIGLVSSLNPSTFEQMVKFTATVTNGTTIPTGSVSFYDGATLLWTKSLVSGVASDSTALLTAGPHTIKAIYSGDANFKADSTTITQTVGKHQAHAQITSNLNPSLFEQHVTFTLHVTNGTNVPTGNVAFYDGASLLGTIALDGSGNAAYSDSTLAVGSHDIKGIYGGDGNFLADSSTVTQVVNHASPTMAILSSLNPSVYEDTVTFSVTVHNGSHTPGGTITFYDGTTEIGSNPLVSGAASLTTAALTAGSHVIKAVYSGDGSFTADSTQLTQTVDMHQGHIGLVSSLNPSTFEQMVKFTATVTNGTTIPTGSVSFYDGAALLWTKSLVSGVALDSTALLTAGPHTIKAIYSGDANFKADSTTITQTVDKHQAHAQITSNLNPSLFEQHVTFTLHVTNDTNVPTGNVAFYDGVSLLGTIALDGSGNAAYSDSTLAVGSHDIKGVYGGDGNFLADSSTVTQAVNHASPTMAMLSSLNPSVYEDTVTFSVTVHNGSHTPGGTITFYDGTTEIGSNPLVSGAASLTTAALTAGSHVIKAVYSGDGSFTADSTQLTQTVDMHQGHIGLVSSLNPSTFEQMVKFTATVTNGTTIPTGSVSFYDGAALLWTKSLVSGVASDSTALLTAGPHTIKAIYSGDGNFKADSTTITQTVDKHQAHAQITSNLNPSLFEQHVTFTLHVTNGTNVPTGNVAFYDGASLLGTIALDGSGNAAYSDSTLAVGSHDIKGVYGGDGNFLADSSTVAQVVNHASPTMAILSSLNPSVYEDTVTFSVTVHNGSHTPGGTITFYDGTTELGSNPLVSGAASLTTAALTAGSHVIKAVYSGDGSFTADSTQLTQTVDMHQGHIGLVSSLNPSTFEQMVKFTATVTNETTIPTGSVSFYDGTTLLWTKSLVSGVALDSTAALVAGPHTIKAIYSGDANFKADSTTLVQTVHQAQGTMSIISSKNPSTYTDTVSFTAHVTNGSNIPTGLVTFYDGAASIGSASLDGTGHAAVSTHTLTAGAHAIKAVYDGDANFKADSATVTQNVNKAPATLAVSDLIQVYDGTQKAVVVTTTPIGLTGVSVTYNGSATVPTNVGAYVVVSSLTNDNYAASNVTDTLKIQATITSSAGPNGAIAPLGATIVNPGASQLYKFTPQTGYHVDSVIVDGTPAAIDTQYTFSDVSANHTIHVAFAINVFTITSSATNGTIAPTPSVNANYGGEQQFTYTPTTGYHFDSVVVSGVKYTDSTTSYTLKNVRADSSIHAYFSINQYTITSSATNGTITPTPSIGMSYGGDQQFTYMPTIGYHFDSVVVSGVKYTDSTASFTVKNVRADSSIHAYFSINKYTVTSSATNGTIAPTPSASVDYGSSQVFTYSPTIGYHFDSVVVSGVKYTDSTSTYTVKNVRADSSIHVFFSINKYTVTSSATSGTIAPTPSANVNYGGEQQFTYSPATGYHFDSVVVSGVKYTDSTASYTVKNVRADSSIHAYFSINKYTVTSSATNGTIAPTPSASVNYGSNQVFTYSPTIGYHFDSVVVSGVKYIDSTTGYTVKNVRADSSIHAYFSINKYTVTSSVTNGTIAPTPSASVNYGSNQVFTYSPTTGYHFDSVVVSGVKHTDSTASYTVKNVRADSSIHAYFSINKYTVTSAATNGTIAPTPSASVNYGSDQAFTYLPTLGYHFDSVVVSGVKHTDSTVSYTVKNVRADSSIHAYFSINKYTITASAGANGSITPSGAVVLNYGMDTTFTIIPASGYKVDSLYIDGVSQVGSTTYAFTGVNANHTISATFALLPSYANMFRTFTYDSLIVQKPIKKKATREYWEFSITNTASAPVTQVNISFKNDVTSITDAGGLTASGSKKVWALNGSLAAGQTIVIKGYSPAAKVQVINKLWLGPVAGKATKEKIAAQKSIALLPMPNAANVRDDVFGRALTKQGGMLVGVDRTDSSKAYGWVVMKKSADMWKSLYDKTVGPHKTINNGFLVFTSTKSFIKKQGSLSPKVQNNRTFADLMTLKLNIAMSALGTTPRGFGELRYVESGSPFAGMLVRDIASLGDSMMTLAKWARFHAHPEMYGKLDTALLHINSAFSAPFDTTSWSDTLKIKATVRVIDTGILTPTSVAPAVIVPMMADAAEEEVPVTAKLYQNYPNPFNPTTNIQFDLPQSMIVTMKIYNILGQEVATLLDHEQRSDGNQEVQFNGSDLASGVYFYRIIAEPVAGDDGTLQGQSFVSSKKMVLVK